MNACETIQGGAENLLGAEKERILTQTTEIFEACTFQDITGQRIAKVVSALKKIDSKAQSMMLILEKHFQYPEKAKAAAPEMYPSDLSLMNGPQLPGQGISQDDIDKILNESFK